jgi:hypothetical protein
VYWGSSLKVKQPGHEINHSPPPNAEVKNEWSYTYISPASRSGVCRDNCIFSPTLLVIDDNFVDLDMLITVRSGLYVPECFCYWYSGYG